LTEKPAKVVLVPDSMIIMLCGASGIRLILANNCQDYAKNKALEEAAFQGVNDVSVSAKYMSFACKDGAVRVLQNVFYTTKAVFKKTESPCISVDFSPVNGLVASAHASGEVFIWEVEPQERIILQC